MKYLELDDGHKLDLPSRGALPATVHVFDRDSVDAVNAALAAGRPLLVRGEPGTGKSQLARAAADALGRALVTTVIDARTEARDLLWTFDAVTRLAEAQVQGALPDRDEAAVRDSLRQERFLAPGPLWWTFDWQSAAGQAEKVAAVPPPSPDGWRPKDGTVLLIDEIDKADAAVPNGLLECLGEGRFGCPGGTEVARAAGARPLVVITTNEERALPDPFLRRCLVLQMRWPQETDDFVAAIIRRGRAHFPNCGDKVLEKAARTLATDRERVGSTGLFPPGGAEYLDLLRALLELAPGDEKKQLEVLGRIARFVLDKHPAESPW
ncbi:MAG: MoxR family ATPase [Thermoanaerobaculia bacterium]